MITDGIYTIVSYGYKHEILHGYLYRDYFNPLNPSDNLLLQDYRSCNPDDFKLIYHLCSNTTYVLIVTTFFSSKITNFLIFGYGPNN